MLAPGLPNMKSLTQSACAHSENAAPQREKTCSGIVFHGLLRSMASSRLVTVRRIRKRHRFRFIASEASGSHSRKKRETGFPCCFASLCSADGGFCQRRSAPSRAFTGDDKIRIFYMIREAGFPDDLDAGFQTASEERSEKRSLSLRRRLRRDKKNQFLGIFQLQGLHSGRATGPFPGSWLRRLLWGPKTAPQPFSPQRGLVTSQAMRKVQFLSSGKAFLSSIKARSLSPEHWSGSALRSIEEKNRGPGHTDFRRRWWHCHRCQ